MTMWVSRIMAVGLIAIGGKTVKCSIGYHLLVFIFQPIYCVSIILKKSIVPGNKTYKNALYIPELHIYLWQTFNSSFSASLMWS